MAKSLNFNNVVKQYLTVTLSDENNTRLLIGTPTKAVMDELLYFQSTLTELAETESNEVIIDALYRTCAKIMSRNKAGITITSDYLAGILDFEDILTFITSYSEFVSEIINSKN